MTFLVIRARSDRGVTKKIRDTMLMLNLTRVNHATLIPDNVTYAGMLQKSKDYVTWGEVDAETIETLLKERDMKTAAAKAKITKAEGKAKKKKQSKMYGGKVHRGRTANGNKD